MYTMIQTNKMINLLFPVLSSLAALCYAQTSCNVVKRECWDGGCTIDVTGKFVLNQNILITPKNGARVAEIWNAVKQTGCGSSGCPVRMKYDTDHFGFNLDGGSVSWPDVSVSCQNGVTNPTNPGGPPNPSQSSSPTLKPSVTFKSGFDRLEEFSRQLTSVLSGNKRVVHSAGGAAGGVISEGQGYGLLIAGGVVASESDSAKRDKAISYAVSFFNGWKAMCQKTSKPESCQEEAMCSGSRCLPHWKFSDDLSSIIGTGAAPDGDQDAIMGMILLVKATEGKGYSWWNEINNWAYASLKAFMQYNTDEQSGKRILKLGTCWGGWDCINPSYFSPGHWRAFRNFMIQRNPTEGNSYKVKWDNLIKTAYEVLQANQCATTGLVTNWWKPSLSSPTSQGSTGCSGSGTPAAEYGSEASRTMFRVALDYIWYGNEATEGVGAKTFCNRVAKAAAAKILSGTNLATGCNVRSILPGWLDEAFMWGPTATCFVVPGGDANQQAALDKFATKIKNDGISDYFSGSWLALTTLTVNGDFGKAKSVLL